MEQVVVVIIGLVLGSFSTALAYRVPRGIPWIVAAEKKPVRSQCVHCQKNLAVRDLVPVFSWLVNRGCCRFCGRDISVQYPLTELGALLACLGAYITFGFTPEAFFVIACVPFLMALLLIDLERMILPDQLVAAVGVLGVLRLVTEFYSYGITGQEALFEYAAGFLIYGWTSWLMGAVMTYILGRSALGFGDVKFFAVAGLWLGVSNLGWFFVMAGFLGMLIAIIWKIAGRGVVFPFGPSLIVSFYVLLVLEGSLFL